MLSEAETYPDWIPQDPAHESTPAPTEPTTSPTTAGWGIPDAASRRPDAPAWAGFAAPTNDTVDGPSFWASPAHTEAAPPSWGVTPGNEVAESAEAWSPSVNAWADAKPDLGADHGQELAPEPPVETYEFIDLEAQKAQNDAPNEPIDNVLVETPEALHSSVDETPFHQVAAAHASANDVPVAEHGVFVPTAGRWDEPGESTDDLVESDEPAEFDELVVADDIAVAVETNRRSRLIGRLKYDRVAGPSSAPQTQTAELASIMASEALVAAEAEPKGLRAAKTPKPRRANKIDEVDSADTADKVDKADKVARAGFFTKKAPSESGVSARQTPMVLRIAALASLLVGVGLFGYTVVNGRHSTPTAPAVTVAPPASVPMLAPESPGPTPKSAVVVAPAEDPIFGDAPTDGTVAPTQGSVVGATSPIADDNGLAFDTTANFGA